MIARRGPATLFGSVEEPLDPVVGAVGIRAEADRIGAIALWRDVGPRSFLDRKFSDSVSVIASVGK
jgi:hypothetical protein